MDDDIAISTVADLVRRSHPSSQPGEPGVSAAAAGAGEAAAAMGSSPPGSTVVERFESLHQRVASAASSASSAPVQGARRWIRPAVWALAACVLVIALAVWLRPERLLAEEARAKDDGDGAERPLSWLRVAGAGAAAGVVVGGLDLLGSIKQQR